VRELKQAFESFFVSAQKTKKPLQILKVQKLFWLTDVAAVAVAKVIKLSSL
jgi:hypothetical protein